jgi:Zn-dependent protease
MPMKFSRIEKRDLLKAWAAISLAFAIVMGGTDSGGIGLLLSLGIAALTVGIGFLAHELAHKWVAQRYGYWAEFRSADKMLILMIIMSFIGFIFAAPGGVIIQGHVGKARSGRISAAGPIASLTIGALFLLMFFPATGLLEMIARYGFWINSFLGFFNLLPISIFDGKKVKAWNEKIYYTLLGISIVFVSLAFFVL